MFILYDPGRDRESTHGVCDPTEDGRTVKRGDEGQRFEENKTIKGESWVSPGGWRKEWVGQGPVRKRGFQWFQRSLSPGSGRSRGTGNRTEGKGLGFLERTRLVATSLFVPGRRRVRVVGHRVENTILTLTLLFVSVSTPLS